MFIFTVADIIGTFIVAVLFLCAVIIVVWDWLDTFKNYILRKIKHRRK